MSNSTSAPGHRALQSDRVRALAPAPVPRRAQPQLALLLHLLQEVVVRLCMASAADKGGLDLRAVHLEPARLPTRTILNVFEKNQVDLELGLICI